MMEKQAKAPKPKSEKKAKVAEKPAEETSVQPQPAQSIEGTVLLITHISSSTYWLSHV